MNPLWGPLRPSIGIIAHQVASDLLIYPFSLREFTHTREILDPITKDTLYISCLFNHISCDHLTLKEQIKDVKMEGMTLKLWYTIRCFGIKENKFSHIRGLSLNLKVYLNLKGS